MKKNEYFKPISERISDYIGEGMPLEMALNMIGLREESWDTVRESITDLDGLPLNFFIKEGFFGYVTCKLIRSGATGEELQELIVYDRGAELLKAFFVDQF